MSVKTAAKQSKQKRSSSRFDLRFSLLLVLCVAGLAVLFYSVYGQRQQDSLQAGEASPQLYRSPVDIEVIDQIATEREKQQARAQIPPVYSAEPRLQRLVINAVTTTGLPLAVQDFIVTAYESPTGVTEDEIPDLITEAVALADAERQREVGLVLRQILIATSQPNAQLTEAAREAAANAVKPVMRELQAGQIIVREGDPLSADNLAVLEAVGLYNPRAELRARQIWIISASILLALLLSLPMAYAYRRLQSRLSAEQLIFLVGLTLISLAAQRLALLADPSFLFISLVPLLVAVLISDVVALGWGIWLSVIIAVLMPSSALLALLTALVGVISASLLALLFKTRTSLLFAGGLSGLAAAFAFVVYHLLIGAVVSTPILLSLVWIIGGSTLAGILALGLLPLAESNIGFLTDFRLLELSSPSSPLLQKLLIEAPGSYQHSLIISNLVEQAVTNIGGNALLARVGALYHDVGKLKRPHFYVENQFSGENPHDQLSPHLSYLIITSHVRDGIDLLREFKLPKALEPFVLEHHGTTVLSYFYKRALEDSAKLDELNFRYPGPRPRSKETAVLMLADTVESASRTLTEPKQGSIRALIDRLFEQRLQDDQLAESPLNFHDLEVIANTFERMLTAILHRRIHYPTSEEIQGLKNGRNSRRDTALPAS